MNKYIQTNLIFRICLLAGLFMCFLNSSCASPTQSQQSDEIILYNWEGDIPQSLIDAFTEETRIKVRYEVYPSQEEAIENIRAGQVFDVVVIESRFIPSMKNEGLLAKLTYKNIPNYKNISPNFRDLIYDPGNVYSIPYSWGTTALIVRTDMVQTPITRWADLWDAEYAGIVGIWKNQPREVIAMTLKSLGYFSTSEDPAELEAALEKLIELKPHLRFLDEYGMDTAMPALASGDIAVAMGYSGDYLSSKDEGLEVEYIIPEEGAVLWGDTFVIPFNSKNQTGAEMFINFINRPEISAEIVNEKYYASANEAAREFISPQILNETSIFPTNEAVRKAEIILPLSAEGQKLYDEIWQRFLDADTQ